MLLLCLGDDEGVGNLLFTGTSLDVGLLTVGWRVNRNNWNFTVKNGELRITSALTGTSFNLFQRYIYSAFKLENSRFIDNVLERQFPTSILNNITYHPSCSRPKVYTSWHAPYTIQADPYWPMVSFYEQGKYKVL